MFVALVPVFFVIDLMLRRDIWQHSDDLVISVIGMFLYSAATAFVLAGISFIARSNSAPRDTNGKAPDDKS